MSEVTISLPDAIKDFVDQQVSSGTYGDAGESIRRLLLVDQAREADKQLERLLLKSLDSGPEIDVNENFWTELRAETGLLRAKFRVSQL